MSKVHRNCLLIVIDALRYDVVTNQSLLQRVAPNIAYFATVGQSRRVVANASNTQFVMPSLLSGTYPLDHGGTNWGCRERPTTLAEVLSRHGYSTRLFSTCILYDRALDFDRGFDKAVVAANRRRALMQDIEYAVLKPARQFSATNARDENAEGAFVSAYDVVLDRQIALGRQTGRIPASLRRLRRYARDVALGAQREKLALHKVPRTVAQKVASVPEAYYYAVIGRNDSMRLLATRLRNKLVSLILKAVAPTSFRVKLVDAYEPAVEEVEEEADYLLRPSEQPFFSLLHLMDAHSGYPLVDQLWRSPIQALRRVMLAKRFMREIPDVKDIELGLYLAGVNAIDRLLGRHRAALDRMIKADQLVLAIVSDHGRSLKGLDGYRPRGLESRFGAADIDTPFIMCGAAERKLNPHGLYDSRDVSATLLDVLGIARPQGMNGHSMISEPPRVAVVSENAGRGFCDLENDVLNFSITGLDSKILVRLDRDRLEVVEWWPRLEAKTGGSSALLETLFAERASLLDARGVKSLPSAATA